MTQVLPRLQRFPLPSVRGTAAAAAALTRRPSDLTVAGTVSMGLVMALLALLALLPTGKSCLSQTVSVGVYGPYGELVPPALLLFGLGALALGRALRLRLGGTPGRFCGRLVFVWATVSLVDAVIPTNRSGHHTFHGELHIVLAVTGLVAQVVVAVYYPLVLRRTTGRAPRVVLLTAGLVLTAGAFFAVHPVGLAGLAERALFVSSAAWMVVAVAVAARVQHAAQEAADAGIPDRGSTKARPGPDLQQTGRSPR